MGWELVAVYVAAFAAVGALIYADLEYRRKRPKTQKAISTRANIPQHDTPFIGRKEEMESVIAHLQSRFFLIEITGLGGIGKTALAIEIVNKCLEKRVFNGVIWISAKYEQLDIGRFLKEIIAFEYGFTGRELPIQEAKILSRKILSSQKILLIIDNYEDVSDRNVETFLKEIPEPSKIMLTTRHSKIKEVASIPLEGLPQEDCIKVAKNEIRRLQIRRLQNVKDEYFSNLSEATFGIPFLVKWVMGQMKLGYDYRDIVESLLSFKREASEVYDYVLKKSFEKLDKVGIEVLLVVSLSRNPISFDFIVGVVNPKKPNVVKGYVDSLIHQNLLEVGSDTPITLYRVHPLTRNYVHFYVSNTTQFGDMHKRFYEYALERAIWSSNSESPSYTFIEQNLHTILSTIDWHVETRLWRKAVSLQQALSRYLWVRGYWRLRIEYGNKVLDLAPQVIVDKEARSSILMDDLGWTTYVLLGYSEKTKTYILEAKRVFDSLRNYYGMIKSRRHLAAMARDRGEFVTAEEYYKQALQLVKCIEDKNKNKEMEAGLYLSLGKLFSRQEDREGALEYFDKAIGGFRGIDDEFRLLKVLNVKAQVLLDMNRVDEATDIFSSVGEYAKKLQRIDQIPIAFEGLLKCYIKKGKRKLARKYFDHALKAYGGLGSSTNIERLKETYKGLK